jgi:two-component system, OmpR family, response regulator MprA
MARILIVDSNSSFADVLARTLGLEEYDVEVANTAGDGVRLGLADHPDVVIAAWSLRNDVHGGEVCRRIRAASPGTKAVIITGRTELVSQAKRYCGGAAAVLTKPFHREDILGAVRRALCSDAAVPPSRPLAADFRDVAIDTVS